MSLGRSSRFASLALLRKNLRKCCPPALRDSASALRDEVDMLRKQTAQSQAVLKTTIKYLVDFKMKQAETDQKEKKEIKFLLGKS